MQLKIYCFSINSTVPINSFWNHCKNLQESSILTVSLKLHSIHTFLTSLPLSQNDQHVHKAKIKK